MCEQWREIGKKNLFAVLYVLTCYVHIAERILLGQIQTSIIIYYESKLNSTSN